MAREVWFQLANEGGQAVTSAYRVKELADEAKVVDLQDAVKAKYSDSHLAGIAASDLTVLDANGVALDPRASLADIDENVTLTVQVPTQHLVPRSVASVPNLPGTIVLNEPDKYAEECISLTEWAVGAVHEIPLIWRFMRSLGGCTNSGKIFWRMEDKQVVSLTVDGWFRESTPDNINVRANKKSIVMGSPGIGKSTLLCVMAFYLVLKHKKNVLVYRRLTNLEEENCLLYLGYEGDKLVYFSVLSCEESEAKRIYRELRGQHGVSNVWLLLDGFRYEYIPEGVRTFRLLATSQQVGLKSQERVDAYCCLLSCWSKENLLSMGHMIYNFTPEEMEERYYYSGGSVRDFTLATVELTEVGMTFALNQVTDPSTLLSPYGNIISGASQVDRLRHTFVEDATKVNHFTNPTYWKQTVDSEYVVRKLSLRLPMDALTLIYQWARATGHGSLAGYALEISIHRLAAEKRLKLFASEYAPPIFRKPNKPRGYKFMQVPLQTGGAVQWGTSSDYESYLKEWRVDENLTYWFPACDNFPNIDSIVKLSSTFCGKNSCVAYIQVTVATKHDISGKELEKMNKIFQVADLTERPIYIAICPDLKSCKEFILESRPEVVEARRTCDVFVGYCEEDQFAIAADGPKNNIPVKPVVPLHKYPKRSKRQRES